MVSNRRHINQVAIRASLLIACTGFVASPALAQWYVGVGIGSAQAKLANSSQGISSKILAGYKFSPNWGVEGQYVNLGSHNASTDAYGSGSYRPKSSGLAVTATLPLSSNAYFLGKLGVAFNRLSNSNIGGDTNADLLVGVGVGYNFNANWSIRAEYENFNNLARSNAIRGDVKGDNRGVSLKYSF